eukprot:gene22216-29279_t
MSLFDASRHSSGSHEGMLYQIHDNAGGISSVNPNNVVCLGCLLESVQKGNGINTRRSYVLRYFNDVVARHPSILVDMAIKHSDVIVTSLVQVLGECDDVGVLTACMDAIQQMCQAAEFMPQAFMERLLTYLSQHGIGVISAPTGLIDPTSSHQQQQQQQQCTSTLSMLHAAVQILDTGDVHALDSFTTALNAHLQLDGSHPHHSTCFLPPSTYNTDQGPHSSYRHDDQGSESPRQQQHMQRDEAPFQQYMQTRHADGGMPSQLSSPYNQFQCSRENILQHSCSQHMPQHQVPPYVDLSPAQPEGYYPLAAELAASLCSSDANLASISFQALNIVSRQKNSHPVFAFILATEGPGLFVSAVEAIYSPNSATSVPGSGLKMLCLQLLHSLACAGIKSCLVGGEGSAERAASSQLLSSLTKGAAPIVLQQLIEADACEYMFECMRAIKAEMGPATMRRYGGWLDKAPLSGTHRAATHSIHGAAGSADDAAFLTEMPQVLTTLMSLSRQVHYGVEIIFDLLEASIAQSYVPIQADLLAVLLLYLDGPEQTSSMMPMGDFLPTGLSPRLVHHLPPERLLPIETACHLVALCCQKWGARLSEAVVQDVLLPAVTRGISGLSAVTLTSLADGYFQAASSMMEQACCLVTIPADRVTTSIGTMTNTAVPSSCPPTTMTTSTSAMAPASTCAAVARVKAARQGAGNTYTGGQSKGKSIGTSCMAASCKTEVPSAAASGTRVDCPSLEGSRLYKNLRLSTFSTLSVIITILDSKAEAVAEGGGGGGSAQTPGPSGLASAQASISGDVASMQQIGLGLPGGVSAGSGSELSVTRRSDKGRGESLQRLRGILAVANSHESQAKILAVADSHESQAKCWGALLRLCQLPQVDVHLLQQLPDSSTADSLAEQLAGCNGIQAVLENVLDLLLEDASASMPHVHVPSISFGTLALHVLHSSIHIGDTTPDDHATWLIYSLPGLLTACTDISDHYNSTPGQYHARATTLLGPNRGHVSGTEPRNGPVVLLLQRLLTTFVLLDQTGMRGASFASLVEVMVGLPHQQELVEVMLEGLHGTTTSEGSEKTEGGSKTMMWLELLLEMQKSSHDHQMLIQIPSSCCHADSANLVMQLKRQAVHSYTAGSMPASSWHKDELSFALYSSCTRLFELISLLEMQLCQNHDSLDSVVEPCGEFHGTLKYVGYILRCTLLG